MKLVRTRPFAAALVSAAMTLGVLGGSVGIASAAYDPTTPPYPADPNNVTSLTVYDATTGAVVTSGSTATALSGYYFVAKTDFNPGKTKAALSGYLAEAGKAPGAWSGTGLGAATTYPVTAAPAPVNAATTPTAKGGSSSSFGSLAGTYPNTAASGSDFYQLYQLRVKTTFPTPASTTYAYLDLKIDTTAGTWTQVGPAVAAATAPGAPTIGAATAGDASASVAFTAPASDGGSAVTGYTVTSTPGGITATGSTSPISVPGLTNGTAYTFTVKATNAIGTGAASAASNPVTPTAAPTAPGAPTIGTATAGDTTASVAFTPPASDGGSAVTGYTVTSAPGGITATGSSSPISVPGLTNGTAYTFTVKATNAIGTGAASAASNSVTPVAPTAPGAPTIGTATAGDTTASVAFTAPASDGGSAVTGYTVTSAPGGITATGSTSPISVPGLTNGTAYTFTVKATNAIGTGADSAASNSVTPFTVTAPGAPTIGSAVAGNATATVSFSAPASDGGSAVTGYTVTSTPGGVTKTGTSSPLTVTGLTNGTAYTFTVHATNAIGSGAESAASSEVTPTAPVVNVPDAPTSVVATAKSGAATVAFATPASNGAPILDYTVTASTGQTVTGSASPLTVPGLANGTARTFTVTARNSVGSSAASAPSAAVTYTTATLTFSPIPSIILSGRAFHIGGVLHGSSVAGKTIDINVRPDRHAASVLHVRTDGNGVWGLTVRPIYNTIYVVSTQETAGQSAASATGRRSLVRTDVVLTPAGNRSTSAAKVSISGVTKPSAAGQVVNLVELTSGKPVVRARATVRADGTFTFVVSFARGQHSLVVTVPKTASNADGTSARFVLTKA